VRGRAAVDRAALESVLVRFSELVVELPRIAEIDINPLSAAPEGILALDARVVLTSAAVKDEALPRPAIRPYPSQYVTRWKMKNGSEVVFRPIRPEDEPLMVKFHETLSEETVYLRYFHMSSLSTRVAHERLLRKCFIDYNREMALVVESTGANGNPAILAVGRLTRTRVPDEAEVAVLVADKFQHQGLGGQLLCRLLDVARGEKLKRVVAEFHSENTIIRDFARKFGATVEFSEDPLYFRTTHNL
jgi:acetyltransferase